LCLSLLLMIKPRPHEHRQCSYEEQYGFNYFECH
jgi:hypothetical protein